MPPAAARSRNCLVVAKNGSFWQAPHLRMIATPSEAPQESQCRPVRALCPRVARQYGA